MKTTKKAAEMLSSLSSSDREALRAEVLRRGAFEWANYFSKCPSDAVYDAIIAEVR